MHNSKNISIKTIVGNELKLFGVNILFLMLLCAVLRMIFLVFNIEQISTIPLYDLAKSFVIGSKFDLVIISWFLLPLLVLHLLRCFNLLKSNKSYIFYLGLVGLLFIFTQIAELEFYHEFHARLNNLALQYIKEDSSTVLSMVWNGFPIVRYTILASLLCAIYFAVVILINKKIKYNCLLSESHFITKLVVILVIGSLLMLGSRGTIRRGPPLRWGDAYFSSHAFANHLALNGVFTVIKSLGYYNSSKSAHKWLNSIEPGLALNTTRNILLTNNDQLVYPEKNVITRKYSVNPADKTNIKNVVVILMESFSAEFVGSLNPQQMGLNITPEFNRLAQDGLLFTHYFSNGTHTHQGMFNSQVSFPNLPGYEYLMQMPEGDNKFSGLPNVLTHHNFNDVYVYNGQMTWDNQEGFFRNQGMTTFIGKEQFKNPKFLNPTWGVSDDDMFTRALDELDKLHDKNKPFYALLQTLSNHTPFILPQPLPFEPVMENGKQSERLTAMKYSDWALGKFFEAAKKSKYYDDTLFVIVGDHGFSISKQLTPIDLYRFHVPMLLISKDIQEKYGKTNDTVASHLDLAPTVLGLVLKNDFTHDCWGRNLLSLPKDDKGFAIIKPSGNEQTVAMIRGDNIVIETPDGKVELGKYGFYPSESYSINENEEIKSNMHNEMLSFIETSMRFLTKKSVVS